MTNHSSVVDSNLIQDMKECDKSETCTNGNLRRIGTPNSPKMDSFAKFACLGMQ